MRTSGNVDAELLRNVGDILARQGGCILADDAKIDAQETIEVRIHVHVHCTSVYCTQYIVCILYLLVLIAYTVLCLTKKRG